MQVQVEYKNDYGDVMETLVLKRVPRAKLKELLTLVERLTAVFLINNGSMGDILSDDNNWNLMKQVARIIPVVGNDKPGFDIDKLQDDYEQLCYLFFCAANLANDENYKDSLISQLHGANAEANVKKGFQIVEKMREKEIEEKIEEIKEAAEVVEAA